MSMQNSSKINLGNICISFNAFIVNPNKYINLIKAKLSDREFAKKANEQDEKYYYRIFKLVYNQQTPRDTSTPTHRSTTTEPLSEEQISVINAMGMEVTKVNSKSLNVVFKNTGNTYKFKRDYLNDIIEAVKKDPKYKHKKCGRISIGVELEFIANPDKLDEFTDAMIELVGDDRYATPLTYHKNTGKKWELGKDGSVSRRRGDPADFRGFELTSPIFTLGNKKDMQELEDVCELVKNVFEGTVNKTCGTHIHMSFAVDNTTYEMCRYFAQSYLDSEASLFDKLVPKHRRENAARYCLSTNPRDITSRYRKLNLRNVENNTQSMHLEFRQLDGTLDFNKIYAWCKIQKMFVELTLAKWDSFKSKTDESTMHDDTIKINLEDVIVSDEFDMVTNEELMKMSSMIA